ncbi:MAG: hypothetical protein HPY62_01895 [Bacteroidales bacterium]|nr:hypothetical protein [Bacteroidales bacterium]
MKKFLLSAIAVMCIVPLMSQQTATLKLNLEKNKTYRLRSASKQTVVQTVSGNQQTVESEVLYTMSIKMIDATPEFLVTEIHFDTITTKTNTMGKVESFSSTVEGDIKSSETSKIMSYIMNRLSKSALYVKLDYAGQPLEVLNSKILSEMILKDTSLITLTGPTASAIKTQIASTVSDNNLKTMVKSFTWNLPGGQVSTGAEWKIFDQVSSGGMLLAITASNRLDGIKGNNALITVESDIRAPENAPPIKSGGATVTYNNLRGISKSSLVVDTGTGLVTENKSKTSISASLGVSAPGFSMEIPMVINGETVITGQK